MVTGLEDLDLVKDDASARDPSADNLNNPEVERYLALPSERRREDIFLENLGASFWISEYVVDGKPAPFSCSFILHLEPDGDQRTRVVVLEYQPRVDVGSKIDLTHHGFVLVPDLQIVPPTTRDRVEVLERVQNVISDSE